MLPNSDFYYYAICKGGKTMLFPFDFNLEQNVFFRSIPETCIVYVVRTDAYAVNDYSHLNLPSFMYITVYTATRNATMGCMRVCTFQTSAKLPVYCIVHKYTSLRRFYHSHN